MAQRLGCPRTLGSWRQRSLVFSLHSLLLVLALSDLQRCLAEQSGNVHIRWRGLNSREGKHLYCKHSGGCSQCQESEEIKRYCADTGFKELLRCTTDAERGDGWPVVLQYPYPPDVHIDEEEEPDPESGEAKAGSGSGSGLIRVVRSCTENTVAEHVQALAADVAAAEARAGGSLGGQMGLFNFELLMAMLLGLSLPVVYWRKIRIRHL